MTKQCAACRKVRPLSDFVSSTGLRETLCCADCRRPSNQRADKFSCRGCGAARNGNAWGFGPKGKRPSQYCPTCQASGATGVAKGVALRSSLAKSAPKPKKYRQCTYCGETKPRDEWLQFKGGSYAKHCGCLAGRYKYPGLPTQDFAAMMILAKAGNVGAIAWVDERRQLKVEWRKAKAEAKGRAYVERGSLEASPLDDAHKDALRWIVQQRRKVEHMRALHDAHVKVRRSLSEADEFRWRYRNDAEFMLKKRLRNQFVKKAQAVPGLQDIIGAALRSGGSSATVERVLGYSVSALRVHLEKQFTKGMSWASRGQHGWHIDHILPRKCFDLTSIEGVQAYWCLSNLRPLSAKDNISKSAKIEFLL